MDNVTKPKHHLTTHFIMNDLLDRLEATTEEVAALGGTNGDVNTKRAEVLAEILELRRLLLPPPQPTFWTTPWTINTLTWMQVGAAAGMLTLLMCAVVARQPIFRPREIS